MNLESLDLTGLLVSIAVLALIILVIRVAHLVLRNPFRYPYLSLSLDVSGRRNVEIEDCIDKFLCDEECWHSVQAHQQKIERWKNECEARISVSMLSGLRRRQYEKTLDDSGAYRFKTFRSRTRYRQRNYVRQAYRVRVSDMGYSCSYLALANRREKLRRSSFELTVKQYHSRAQRSLMTRELRKKIMERDNYTCRMCGKRMFDEVGLQIDHIIPVARGGRSVSSNLRVLCSRCNMSKGAKIDMQN